MKFAVLIPLLLSASITTNTFAAQPTSPDAACDAYAKEAVQQHNKNLSQGCGFTGPNWNDDYSQHYNWCVGVPETARQSESAARAAALQNCAPSAAEPPSLDPGQLASTFTGKAIRWEKSGAETVVISYKNDGNIHGFNPANGWFDAGKWWTQTGFYCHQWTEWQNGIQHCYLVKRDGADLKLYRLDGSATGYVGRAVTTGVPKTGTILMETTPSSTDVLDKVQPALSLDPGQLASTFTGKAIRWEKSGAETVVISYKNDGNIHGFNPANGWFDAGKWWTQTGFYCHQWTEWQNGIQHCYLVKRDGADLKLYRLDGSATGYVGRAVTTGVPKTGTILMETTPSSTDVLDKVQPAQTSPDAACDAYAKEAVQQHNQNLSQGCGFTGPNWNDDYSQHYNWCVGVPESARQSESATRAAALQNCAPSAAAPPSLDPGQLGEQSVDQSDNLQNIDLQNQLQKQQKKIHIQSTQTKEIHDIDMDVIRKMK